MRRFLGYALSGGLAEVLVRLAGPLLGFRIPLLPAQILWVNMLTHGLPGVALGAEPAERHVMRRPLRRPDEAMLGAGLWRRVAGTGATIGAVSLAAAVWAQASDRPWQSVLFTTLGFAQLGVALAVRSRRSPGAPRNPLLAVAVAVSLALQVAAVQVPVLRALLGTEPLDGVEFAMCAALATVPGLLLVAARRWSGRRSRRASAPARAASRPADPNVGTDEVTQVVERSLR